MGEIPTKYTRRLGESSFKDIYLSTSYIIHSKNMCFPIINAIKKNHVYIYIPSIHNDPLFSHPR